MGCHTWIYKHEKEKNELYKKIILDKGLTWSKKLLSEYMNPNKDMLENLEYNYKSFIEDCDGFLKHTENYTESEIVEIYGSLEEFESEKEFCTNAVNWKYNDYVQYLIDDAKKYIEIYESGEITPIGSFVYPDDEEGHLYCVVDEKIYVCGIIPHGDDLGRIHDYNQPKFFTAEDTIKCFKEHKCWCDEELIKELFANNDMFVEFG